MSNIKYPKKRFERQRKINELEELIETLDKEITKKLKKSENIITKEIEILLVTYYTKNAELNGIREEQLEEYKALLNKVGKKDDYFKEKL